MQASSSLLLTGEDVSCKGGREMSVGLQRMTLCKDVDFMGQVKDLHKKQLRLSKAESSTWWPDPRKSRTEPWFWLPGEETV